MQLRYLWPTCLAATLSYAQSTQSDTRSLVTLTGSSDSSTSFTGTYATNTEQSTVSQTSGVVALSSGAQSGSASTTANPSGYTSLATLLQGGGLGLQTLSIINGTTTISPNATAAGTASSTSTAARATNTQPCNNYVEFCNRKYSNITEVCAHNSAFAIKGNAASNQLYGITAQLDDGIRMIQGETHLVNNTMYSCHTSCSLLNAGTLQSELETVAAWVRTHPYDVITILIVNSDYVGVGNYTAPIQNSGLAPYLYEPPKIPMRLNDWPTLSQMILTQKRVVIFMDYNANQTEVPYILDEFTHMWETPFSPQDRAFPCTVQRPPTLTNQTVARDQYMYLANHNLNQDISIASISLLLPNTAEINVTNAAGTGYGELGNMSQTCTNTWNRPPNFLLVDYYNYVDGSVFEVQAKANGVTYNRQCCGVVTSGASRKTITSAAVLLLAMAFAVMA